MIHIIGNSVIPIEPGSSMALVLRSPLFDNSDGKTPGSFIFNHKLPATKALRKVFGQGHRTTRAGRATSELPYSFQEGSLRYTGTCLLQEANELEYEVLYNVRNGDFAYEASGISLKDLDLGGDRVFSSETYSIATNSNPTWFQSNDEVYPISQDRNLPITHTIVDFTNSFTALDPATFTAPATADYNVNLTIPVILNKGIAGLDVYKNGILLEQMLLNGGVNSYTYSWPLIAGDVLTFILHGESTWDGTWYEIDFCIEPDFQLSFRTSGSLFLDVVAGNQETFDFAVFPIQNPNLFDNFPKDEFQIDNTNISKLYSENFFIQNYWIDGHFPYVLSGVKDGVFISAMNVFTPFVYIKYLVDAIASRLNYEIIDSPFSAASAYFNAVLFNSFAENTYTVDDTRMIGVKPTFNLTDHVPDIPVNTFLNSLGKILGRRIDIDTDRRTLTFVSLKSVIESTDSIPFPGIITEAPTVIVKPEYQGYKIEFKAASDKFISERIKQANSKHVYKGSVEHINQLPLIGNKVNDMYLVTALNEFYVFKYNTAIYQLGWVYHSQNFYLTKQVGSEPFLEVSCSMAPVIDNLLTDKTVGAPENRRWRIPVTWQPGNFEGFPDMSAEYGLQILFYRGLWPDSNNEMYPMAVSSQNTTAGYMPFTHPNMCLDGPTPNSFTEELQAWIEWLVFNTKPVKLKAILTPAQLKQIRYAKKCRILGNNYLIEEIRVNLIDDHLSEADIKAYTC